MGPLRLEAVPHAGTTEVHRASRGATTVFLRLAENVGEPMEAEAWVHEALRRRGVRVPAVVAVAPVGDPLDRGVLVVAQLPGVPLAAAGLDAGRRSEIVREAGRDIARIGRLPVAGFGFVDRDRAPLHAPLPDARALVLDGLDAALERLAAGALGRARAAQVERLVRRHAATLDGQPSRLAHGDLDETHVYVDAGRYAGLIDFGEMRGAPPCYDAAHFAVHDRPDAAALPALLAGMRDVAPLPDGHARLTGVMALVLGVERVDRFARRGRPELVPRFAAAVARLAEALATRNPG